MQEVKIAKEKSDSILNSMKGTSPWRKEAKAGPSGAKDATSFTNEIDSPGVQMPFSVHHNVEQDDVQRPHHQNTNNSDALDFVPARQRSPMFGFNTKPLISPD